MEREPSAPVRALQCEVCLLRGIVEAPEGVVQCVEVDAVTIIFYDDSLDAVHAVLDQVDRHTGCGCIKAVPGESKQRLSNFRSFEVLLDTLVANGGNSLDDRILRHVRPIFFSEIVACGAAPSWPTKREDSSRPCSFSPAEVCWFQHNCWQ